MTDEPLRGLRLRQDFDRHLEWLLENARAEGYQQGLRDCEDAVQQGLPALNLLLTVKLPPRPVGQEVKR